MQNNIQTSPGNKSPQPISNSKGSKFYGVATGFFSLKTVQDQESVIKCLRAFRNFKVSKSPDPYLQNYDEYESKEEVQQEKQDKNQELMIQFNPLNYIDPEEEKNVTAMHNLGLEPNQFYKQIHIQDFYNIKESKQMQMRRYFTKVSEIQQKIKAIMLERKRIEGEQGQRNREKQLLAANIMRINSGSPKYRGYGSDGEDKYQKRLKEEKKNLKREIQLQARQFIKNEEKVAKFNVTYSQQTKFSKDLHYRDIESKVQTTRSRNIYHNQRLNIFRSQEREKNQERIEENKRFQLEQKQFIEDNEKKQKQKEKQQYERDQEGFKQRTQFYTSKEKREAEEYEKIQKLNKKIQFDLDNKAKKHDEIVQNQIQILKSKEKNVDYYRDLQKQKQQQYQQQMITSTYTQLEKQKQILNKVNEEKQNNLKQKIKQNNKKMANSQQKFFQINQERKEHLNQAEQNLQQRIYTSDVIKKDYQEYLSHNLLEKQSHKKFHNQTNKLEEQQKAERKKDQILLKQMQRQIILDKEANEYTNYVKKKLKMRVLQKKQIDEITNVLHTVKDKVTYNNDKLKKYELQDQNKNNTSRTSKKDTKNFQEKDDDLDSSLSYN